MEYKINKNLVNDIKNVVNYSSNADDCKKAERLLDRAKKPRSILTEDDCIEFLANIEHEQLHLPKESWYVQSYLWEWIL